MCFVGYMFVGWPEFQWYRDDLERRASANIRNYRKTSKKEFC